MRLLAIFVLSLTLVGCMAKEQPLNFTSTSGKPEVSLQNLSLDEAKNKLIDGCLNKGLQIEQQGNSSVICWKTLEGGSSILATLAIGNSYSTAPIQKTQFVFTEKSDSVRIVGTRMWIETQMAFGQTRTQDLTANHQINSIQDFLRGL